MLKMLVIKERFFDSIFEAGGKNSSNFLEEFLRCNSFR